MARDLIEGRPEDAGLSPAGLDGVDAGLQSLIDKGELAGAVTLVARHGRIVRRSVLGVDDRDSGRPLKTDTLFRIFSMTKPVTAVAMMILHDQGLWKPEDPVSKFLPAWSNMRVFTGLDDAGEPLTAAADRDPTVGDLMTHTAGITYGSTDEPLDRLYKAARIWESADLAQFAAKIGALPLAYQPGTKWVYSLAMDVQGAIIEALTGQTLADFMHENIFAPLGMIDTGFFATDEQKPRLARLYRSSTTGPGLKPLDRSPMLTDHMSPPKVPSGGGGLVSTLDDYARFAQMILNRGELGGKRIVSPEAVTLMATNHLSDELINGGFGVGNMQIRPGFGYGFNGAVFTDPIAAGLPVGRGTYEWDGAAGTWFWVDFENDLIFVGMIQRFEISGKMTNAQQFTQKLLADAIIPGA
ncbi:MAG: beta-lactamase family protein [Proteobacteria bacterium]|nr:beta-lactamase family protein [Pseudomonadota bacterium]